MIDTSQTTLLRVAAFLVDALTISIVLVLPATIASYAMAWIGGTVAEVVESKNPRFRPGDGGHLTASRRSQ